VKFHEVTVLHNPPPETRTLGADLRALRKARGLTLAGMADSMGKSVGWMSQIERDISEPSISDLRALAKLLDVSVSSFFRVAAAACEEGFIVRKTARRPIGSREAGLVEELLSPDLTDDFEVVHSTFEAGSSMEQAISRPTQEVGYITAGQLDLWIGDTCFHLNVGDSFRIRGQSYRWSNPHDVPCVAIWVIAPPVY